MGSWNGTDFLTQLPIIAGDKMRLVFIHKSPFFENRDLASACYHTDMYRPFPIPLKGEYNDYGSIEQLVPSLSHEMLVEQFKASVIEVPYDDERDKYVDRNSVVKDKLTVEYLLERAQEGALYAHIDTKDVGVGYVMIREDMYQAIINATTTSFWTNKEASIKIFREGAAEYLKGLKDYEIEIKTEIKDDVVKRLKRSLDDFRVLMMEPNPAKRNPFLSMLSPMYGVGGPNFNGCDRFLRKKIENGMAADDPRLVEFVYELAEFMFFNMSLGMMRKAWQPQCGAGSQGDEYGLHAVLANAVLSASSICIKEQEESRIEYLKYKEVQSAPKKVISVRPKTIKKTKLSSKVVRPKKKLKKKRTG